MCIRDRFSEGIPSSLLEAARIDGAGEVKTFMNVALPIIQLGIGALAIFTFINAWNEYPLQLIMLSKTEAKTIALGIAGLQSEMSNDFGLIMAGAALAAVPIILVFLAFQRYFTQGITMGAVKMCIRDRVLLLRGLLRHRQRRVLRRDRRAGASGPGPPGLRPVLGSCPRHARPLSLIHIYP